MRRMLLLPAASLVLLFALVAAAMAWSAGQPPPAPGEPEEHEESPGAEPTPGHGQTIRLEWAWGDRRESHVRTLTGPAT